MDIVKLQKIAKDFVENDPDNIVSEIIAISPKVIGLKMYEPPIFAVGNALDEAFINLKKPNVVGEHFLLPTDWMSTAKSVISLFIPFTDEVKKSNIENIEDPSDEWLHARIEGQAFINKLLKKLQSEIQNAGFQCVIPSLDNTFKSTINEDLNVFTSNWSERHVAYVCGLGTFGLSKGLITEKGIAGRMGSLITDMPLVTSVRKYNDIYEYCTMCGECIKNCPVNAISFENGKNHVLCSAFLDDVLEKHKPRYGCGKCQVGGPCSSSIPKY